MTDLLRADLRRSVKDKLFLVLCIIGGVFALIIPLLYKGIFMLLGFDQEMIELLSEMGLGINAKSMLFSSFSLGNNFGLMLPIFVTIIICKDFGGGTIRNKIISGKSRASIYFSMLITTAILVCGFIFAHAILTMLVSLIFFDYQPTAFTMSDFGYLMASLGMELLIYFMVSAIITFFIVNMKRAGLSIVMYFVVYFVMTVVGSIIGAVYMFADPDSAFHGFLEFLNASNAFTTTAIGTGMSYALKDILYLVLPNAALCALIVGLGYLTFRKKDIK